MTLQPIAYMDLTKKIKYDKKNLISNNIDSNVANILSKYGIPVFDNIDYFSFYASPKPNYLDLDGVKYLVIGFKNETIINDNIILFNIEDNKVYFMSYTMKKVGFSDKIITYVNNNINTFILFTEDVANFIDNYLRKEINIDDIINIFSSMLKKIYQFDSTAFLNNDFSFWRECMQKISVDIMESYDIFIPFNDYLR